MKQWTMKKVEIGKTYLNFSLDIVLPPLNTFSRYTRAVVKIEKIAPKPRTTRYPTPSESGASPPKKLSCPAYSAG
jgi:hypothetical protein